MSPDVTFTTQTSAYLSTNSTSFRKNFPIFFRKMPFIEVNEHFYGEASRAFSIIGLFGNSVIFIWHVRTLCTVGRTKTISGVISQILLFLAMLFSVWLLCLAWYIVPISIVPCRYQTITGLLLFGSLFFFVFLFFFFLNMKANKHN